jgi:hypothetical protein
MTPRARPKSPESTRSLTERRPSSASATNRDPKKNDTTHTTESITNTSIKQDDPKENHAPSLDRKNSAQKIEHVDGMDDVILGEGE